MSFYATPYSWEDIREGVMIGAFRCVPFLIGGRSTFAKLGKIIGATKGEVRRWNNGECEPGEQQMAKLRAMSGFWYDHCAELALLKIKIMGSTEG